jgi:hypothetical protein
MKARTCVNQFYFYLSWCVFVCVLRVVVRNLGSLPAASMQAAPVAKRISDSLQKASVSEKTVGTTLDNCATNMADEGVAKLVGELLNTVLRVAGCCMHIVNWAYKTAIEKQMKAGLGQENGLQAAYSVAWLCEQEDFEPVRQLHAEMKPDYAKQSEKLKKVTKPVDSRWDTVHYAVCAVLDDLDLWRSLAQFIMEGHAKTTNFLQNCNGGKPVRFVACACVV